MNPIDQIPDEENHDNIVLYNEKNEPMEFMKIAVISLEGVLYLILKPLETDLIAEDEALVFFIDEFEGEECISLVDDDEIVERVFKEYYDLLRQEGLLPDNFEE